MQVEHQLDQCTFMFVDGTELVGLIGVNAWAISWWLDVTTIPSSQLLCQNLKELFNEERGMRTIFTLTGIVIETLPDGGFHLRQQGCVDQLELMSLSQRRSRGDTS